MYVFLLYLLQVVKMVVEEQVLQDRKEESEESTAVEEVVVFGVGRVVMEVVSSKYSKR